MKTCTKCGKEKPVEAFGINRPDCKLCVNARMAAYRLAHPDTVWFQSARYRSTKRTATRGLYEIWHSMMRRCYQKTHHAYQWYGARGIMVCDEWHDFQAFYSWASQQDRRGLFIDRIDNDMGYSPGNCRFIGPKASARNRRGVKITPEIVSRIKRKILNGLSCAEIARDFGITIKHASDIRRNRSWRDIAPRLPEMPKMHGGKAA